MIIAPPEKSSCQQRLTLYDRYLRDGENIGALMVLDEVCHRVHNDAHAEAEAPGQDDHPPALAGLHDHGVAHALVDAEVPVHREHHQGHQGRPHDGGHHRLD